VPTKGRSAKKAEHVPASAILKKRGLGYGRQLPVIQFRVSGDQLAELEAEVAEAKKAKDDISVNEAARRRCFPEGPKLIRVVLYESGRGDAKHIVAEGLSVEDVLGASWLQRLTKLPGFTGWGVIDERFLAAGFEDGGRFVAARIAQGHLHGLPKWRGK
jgi:hypothetical protein